MAVTFLTVTALQMMDPASAAACGGGTGIVFDLPFWGAMNTFGASLAVVFFTEGALLRRLYALPWKKALYISAVANGIAVILNFGLSMGSSMSFGLLVLPAAFIIAKRTVMIVNRDRARRDARGLPWWAQVLMYATFIGVMAVLGHCGRLMMHGHSCWGGSFPWAWFYYPVLFGYGILTTIVLEEPTLTKHLPPEKNSYTRMLVINTISQLAMYAVLGGAMLAAGFTLMPNLRG